MVLALMSNDVRAAFLLIGVLVFLAGALLTLTRHSAYALTLGLLGLALVFFPPMYDAFAA